MNWTPPQRADAPLSDWVRPVRDWPQAGVLFRDLTPLWADANAWSRTVRALAKPFDAAPPAMVLGIEARGFLVAAALAARWNAGVLLARKPGKLPGDPLREEYALEYGRASLETHRDLLRPGARVLIADDVIATGGTAQAAYALARGLGCAPIGFAFLVELIYLGGRAKLEPSAPVHAVIAFDGEGRATIAE
ncbi:MAG TPA: adenine phosphoribosyltransferase [Candidatus Eisenbacteria bacterium]|nr:adenine phosphoribosyltransferase [Candidatus Eisenbacteria bacterium]